MSRPLDVTPDLLAGWALPRMPDGGDKEDRGRVLVLGGGVQVAGATVLTGVAALRTGAGKLQIAAPRSLAAMLALTIPEARVIPGDETPEGELAAAAADDLATAFAKSDAGVLGPGMLDEAIAGRIAARLARADGPTLVVDAAAAVGFANHGGAAHAHDGRLVLTPHRGEMAALTGCSKADIDRDPLGMARGVAARFQAVVALKGAETFVVSPDGQTWRHQSRTPGLATSGSGDVLAGVIAGLAARGCSPAQAAVWGVAAHAAAGERLARRVARLGFLARELLDEIAPALAALETAAAA